MFAEICKKGESADIISCLEHNSDLLNCLNGEPLRQAVLNNNIEGMKALMNQTGLKMNLKNKNGWTPIMESAKHGNVDLLQVVF